MLYRRHGAALRSGLRASSLAAQSASALEQNAITVLKPGGEQRVLVKDERLSRPDTLAQGPDGAIFVTTSRIQKLAQYHENGSPRTEPYILWKFVPPDAGRALEHN